MSPYFSVANLIMVISTWCGRSSPPDGAAAHRSAASLLSVAAFDFFFIPPYFSFAVSDIQYVLTFGVMLVVALLISSDGVPKTRSTGGSHDLEVERRALYAMSRELATHRGVDKLTEVACRHLHSRI